VLRGLRGARLACKSDVVVRLDLPPSRGARWALIRVELMLTRAFGGARAWSGVRGGARRRIDLQHDGSNLDRRRARWRARYGEEPYRRQIMGTSRQSLTRY
jgi:hypothetical protein